MLFVCYPKCTTCQKARKWLQEKGMEFEERDIKIQNPTKEIEEMLLNNQKAYEEELKHIKENGLRESTEWWDTTHNSIYDINNKKLWVTVHERYQEGPSKFSL